MPELHPLSAWMGWREMGLWGLWAVGSWPAPPAGKCHARGCCLLSLSVGGLLTLAQQGSAVPAVRGLLLQQQQQHQSGSPG